MHETRPAGGSQKLALYSFALPVARVVWTVCLYSFWGAQPLEANVIHLSMTLLPTLG